MLLLEHQYLVHVRVCLDLDIRSVWIELALEFCHRPQQGVLVVPHDFEKLL